MKIAWLVLLACWSMPLLAHKASDSYLQMSVAPQQLSGQWDIALRDLDYALGLDSNADRAITWGEVRGAQAKIIAYAFSRLQVTADGQACPLEFNKLLANQHTDGGYAVLAFTIACPTNTPQELALAYQLLFDLDPSHRGLVRVVQSDGVQTAVLGPEQPQRSFGLAQPSKWREFFDFCQEGVWHIWTGYDHILFLFSLLLPAVLWRGQNSWQPVATFRLALLEVLKVATAFTVAHSLTLSLAVLHVVELPSRWVEATIAASVVLAAFNNLYPMVSRRLWLVAFGFGLIHGLGFASVLNGLELPAQTLLVALLGFNLGVETGQFAIISLYLPLAFYARHSWCYQRLALGLGSWLIAAVASIWFFERSLGFS